MNAQLLRQLGIDQQVLSQMVDEQVSFLEAERQGITRERRRARAAQFIEPSRRSRRTDASSAKRAMKRCCASSGRRCTKSQFEEQFAAAS